ncbi:MAG: hypothetical protein HY670_05720 [Chloroflexi bacterium]|nr:hypothetical protein [Chloroflexota bacterium]
MGQFLQSYGIWILLGAILLFLVIRTSYSAGRRQTQQSIEHNHNGGSGTGTDPNRPNQHGGCC